MCASSTGKLLPGWRKRDKVESRNLETLRANGVAWAWNGTDGFKEKNSNLRPGEELIRDDISNPSPAKNSSMALQGLWANRSGPACTKMWLTQLELVL